MPKKKATKTNKKTIIKPKKRTGTGTKEWAEKNINIGLGCSHDCLYCYARSMAVRYGRLKRADWSNEIVDKSKVESKHKKYKGTVMFPTTHDISPDYLPHAITVLRSLLKAGNEVLIVSKPHLRCIKRLCDEFGEFKKQILFRFTVGTLKNEVAKFWEPGAPSPSERLKSLAYAFDHGFNTSVSMEPMLLGTDDALITVKEIAKHVSETIWLGKMKMMRTRVDTSIPKNVKAIEKIEALQSNDEIKRLVKALKGHRQVKWKDSIKAVMAKSKATSKSKAKKI